MAKQMTRDVVAPVRMLLGVVIASVLIAWMAVTFLFSIGMMFTARCVVLLAHAIRRLLLALRIVRPTTASRSCCAAEDVIDV